MKIAPKFHVRIFYIYTFWEISSQKALWSDRVWPCRFIVLNDSASPKLVIRIYSNFFKVLELFECRRGDPFMIANRNFVELNSRTISSNLCMHLTITTNSKIFCYSSNKDLAPSPNNMFFLCPYMILSNWKIDEKCNYVHSYFLVNKMNGRKRRISSQVQGITSASSFDKYLWQIELKAARLAWKLATRGFIWRFVLWVYGCCSIKEFCKWYMLTLYVWLDK